MIMEKVKTVVGSEVFSVGVEVRVSAAPADACQIKVIHSDKLNATDLLSHRQKQALKKSGYLPQFSDSFSAVFEWRYDAQKPHWHHTEQLRQVGNRIQEFARQFGIERIAIETMGEYFGAEEWYALLEGLLLGRYEFRKYKRHTKDHQQGAHPLREVYLPAGALAPHTLSELLRLVSCVYRVRDLVTEQAGILTAMELAHRYQQMAQEAGMHCEVFDRKQIEALRMNGLLTVNRGSVHPPAFVVLEYKPQGHVNARPVVLVGKGVVFDTGGINLKPYGANLEWMKCDMAGSATVVGVACALALNKVPLWVVVLTPLTDNRPGENAVVPGDIIEYADGTTVEVANTDAEGRLILADALIYARRYEPDLMVDVATLTGSARRAVGPHGAVAFFKDVEQHRKALLLNTGFEVYERLVEFPLWDEYAEDLRSNVADFKNVAGHNLAGAIIAAKFLEKFVRYPWIHLDIAGTAFAEKPYGYISAEGTGWGVRLLYRFLRKCYSA